MRILNGLMALGMTLSACGGDEDTAEPNYYSGAESAALGAATNQADCATCHSNDGTTAGFSGNTFKDIAYRSAFKGGEAPNLLAGANACVTGWMGGTALTAQDARWLALEAYLQSISDPAVTTPNAIAPEVLADEPAYTAAYEGGSASAGQAKYQTYCANCHGGARVVGGAPAWTLAALKGQSVGRIAQKVRTSGPPPSAMSDAGDTTPGPMPFFEPKELSQADLRDIIAFIKQ